MLQTLTAWLQSQSNLVVPELTAYVTTKLLPVLAGGSATSDNSLLVLRNELVHGGGTTQAAAQKTHQTWTPRLETLIADLAFLSDCAVCALARDGAQQLIGPYIASRDIVLPEASRVALRNHEGHVMLIRDAQWLELWPLCDYGYATMISLEGTHQSRETSPLIFNRSDQDRLLYAALGVDMPQGERRDVVPEFRSLFQLDQRLNEPRISVEDFEREMRDDAAKMVGRKKEIQQAKAIIKAQQQGVCWIGGLGKSLLMAKLADEFGNSTKPWCRIAWRFHAGDPARNSRVAFLRYAVPRLTNWLGSEIVPANTLDALQRQLRERKALKKAGGNGTFWKTSLQLRQR